MKVPSRITIASHEYEVLFDDFQEDKEFRGTFSTRRHTILLNPHLHPQHVRVTFLHELVHLICEVKDIGMREEEVHGMAEGLGDILFRCLGLDFDFSDIEVTDRDGKHESVLSE